MHARDEARLVRGAGGAGAAWYEPAGDRLVLVQRPLEELDAPAETFLVRAPAGFGATTLVRLWSATREREVVHLDDVVLTDELVDDLLARTDGSRVVVCARVGLAPDPVLDRLAGHAHCVDGEALRLGEEQVIDLWTGLGLARRGDRLEELARAVGGWARLARQVGRAVLAAPDGEDPLEVAVEVARELLVGWVAEELTGEERALLAGLVRPVLLSAGSAAVVLHRPEPEVEDLLERLARLGFLAREDEGGGAAYRWPDAVRAALRDLLATEHDRVADAELARWYVTRREPDVALDHVLAAGDEAVAREVLGRAWLPLIVYRHAALADFFRAAPPGWFEDPDDYPHGVRQLALIPPGKTDEWARRAPDPTIPAHLPRDARTALNLALVQVFGLRRARRIDDALAAGRRLCALARQARADDRSEVEDLLATSFLLSGLMHELAGDLSGAVEPFRWAAETADVSGNIGSARHSAAHLAMNLAVLGEVDEAAQWLAAAAAAPATGGWVSPRARISVWVAEVLVAVARAEQDAAKVALRGLLTVRDPLDELWPFVLYARACYTRSWGDRRAEMEGMLAEQVAPAGSQLDGLLRGAMGPRTDP